MTHDAARSRAQGAEISRLNCQIEHWACPDPVPPREFARLRNRLVLDHAKWDPQVGDVSTLAPFPLIIPTEQWIVLRRLAERLAAEAEQAEAELLEQPRLLRRLGLPRGICLALADRHTVRQVASGVRVCRFDFHPTRDGWRISEGNIDVPGGYSEASEFPRLMAEHYPDTAPAGHPGSVLADRLKASLAAPELPIALLAAAGYMEDQQVTAYLAGLLGRLGCQTQPARPGQIVWSGGSAHLEADWYRGPLGAVFRFYQGEWLTNFPERTGWPAFVRGTTTPVCNSGSALLVESKRFPLVWDELHSPLETWRDLLPEACDPRCLSWNRESGWLLKTALCNTGDTVAAPGLVEPARWRRAWLDAMLHPGRWVAQRRFEAIPIPSPLGPVYPCLGVYTINGSTAGVYGRIATRPLIDYQATDISVLIRPDEKTRADGA